jgi:thioredoxin-dependent peroxiredoxin
MSITKFKGQPVQIAGEFVKAGAAAPDFELVKTDLSTLSLKDLRGKQVILNIFPSLDTGVCAASVRKFNKLAAELPGTVVLAVSKEGIENVVPVSDFRKTSFDESYGVLMTDGPLKGLLARSVVVIDGDGKVVYTELVPEITQEPDYDKALAAVKR